MKHFKSVFVSALLCVALAFSSCAGVKTVTAGALSAENILSGSRLFHAARISSLFQYIDLDSIGESAPGEAVEPLIPCSKAGCAHDCDSCPAYIRGMTCWVAQKGADGGDLLWYAQLRSYIDTETHEAARHNVIARLNAETGATDTLLQDWEFVIDQLLLYDGYVYFLSGNADGLRDVWVMPESGGTPMLYVQNDGVDIVMLGMEDGVLFLQNEDGGIFRAASGGDADASGDAEGDKVTLTQLVVCEYNLGIYLYGGYIYYPVPDTSAGEYEFLPGRTELDEESGEDIDVAVAVNSCAYYRIPVSGGDPEYVVSGVQATTGGLCAGGYLYLPVWDFEYYGSTESGGSYNDYFSRTSGAVAAVELDNLYASTAITGSDWDFSAVYAVTDRYVFGKASNPSAAYNGNSANTERYVLYDRTDGSVRVVDFN